jgi:hypothetical protein
MNEYIINLHMHTRYSDGSGTHAEIAADAIKAGVDVVIVTDHNVHVQGLQGYRENEMGRVLVLIGEEVHDQARQPQKSHLLVFNAKQSLSGFAEDPQELIDAVNDNDGLSFLAHPVDPPGAFVNEPDLSWADWDVAGFTGIELWNAMTEFKSHLQDLPNTLYYAFNFPAIAHSPFADTLTLWDRLLAGGRPVVAVGGSDAHRFHKSLGPISRTLFPYEKHFRTINTHIVSREAFTGDADNDAGIVYRALRTGHCFVGNDAIAPTRGFRFTATCPTGVSLMGDTLSAQEGATLQIKLPELAEYHLLKDGKPIRSKEKRQALVHKVTEPGVYRVEAYRHSRGKRRGWIFSNPIYIH